MTCVIIFLNTCLLGYGKVFSFINGKRERALELSDSVPHIWAEPLAELPLLGENPSPKWGNPQA